MNDSLDVNMGAFDGYSDFNVSSENDEKLAFKINEMKSFQTRSAFCALLQHSLDGARRFGLTHRLRLHSRRTEQVTFYS
jgi:hypothetical protein